MISYIKWSIKNIELNSIIVLTEFWIWYELIINELIYANIYNKNNIELYIYHNITENWQTLFWFLSIEDRFFFKELIKISWIWGKVAQNILSLWISRLKEAILDDDKNTIESIKWVWKKMAQKIVLELRDKDFIKDFEIKNKDLGRIDLKNTSLKKDMKNEIMSTLTNMWYNSKKVEELLENLPSWYDSIEKIIPYIIKNI